ncbi:ABC transporter permease [Paraburkholderia phenoliruptrix]|uniref:Spermidine/putrescine transport system permease protein n=2 Tax=Paraburkholderia phenoliruptrix TaxID=252970 RepID=K0DW90_9BURK|nr:ABC transporter permease [Paraburkholderia phenoliruptrix]AFT88248.1 spermidine/putrescine transport system permease protein [Paraburkholderia phenoliruptrix BR3459a]MDR6418503.1 putative spermidine/putrescine transport system permease protein [Paraburkholderia phenoliruptrix]CAB4047172.1 Spermidine/putrescine transport system permease protein PotB [Paraburkholderia phenoliruptrix]
MDSTLPATENGNADSASARRAPWRAFVPLWLMCLPAFLLFVALVLVPLLMTLVLSFYRFDPASGPLAAFQLGNYVEVLGSSYFHTIFLRTFGIAFVVTLLCVVIGTPEAYVLSRMRDPYRSMFLLVILAPLLVSVVVRAFGWSMLLNSNGLVNQAFALVGLGPYKLEYTTFAIVIALVHVMLPFMVIPVWTALQKLDPQTENAALSLMASPATTLRRIVLPQLTPGILSGSLMVFGLSASAFAIPGLLGGRRLKVAATAVYDEFLGSLNWPLGATIALLLLLANLIVMLTYYRVLERRYARSLG